MICEWAMVFASLLPGSTAGELAKDVDGVVYTSQRAFRIPLDLTEAERRQISAIRLFVSEDGGKTWFRHSDGPPDLKAVTFRATKDGGYAFGVAMVLKDGTQLPPDMRNTEPGLKVVVDTTQPNLVIRPVRSKSGKRGVRWEIDDANIEPQSLRLAVWEENTGRWRPFDVRHPERAMVWFDDGQDVRKVQALIRDRAGNASIQQVDIIGDRFTRQALTTFALVEPVEEQGAPLPAFGSAPGRETIVDDDVRPVQHLEAGTHTVFAPPQAPPETPLQGTTQATTSAMPADREVPLYGVEPLQINYEVEATEGFPIAKVELWGTKDKGQTWKRIASDTDKASPIEAALPEDGVWGLKVVAASAAMAKEMAPAPGTPPDAYVEIDRVPPTVNLRDPDVHRGQVLLQWTAGDKNLGPGAVSLSFAENPSGPWKPIARDIQNEGIYRWRFLDAGVTGRLHFRIEVRDEAGNVGVAETAAPVALELPQPKSRVTGIQPKLPAPPVKASRRL